MARLRRESGHRSAQAVLRPPDDRSGRHATVPWTCLVIPRHRVVDRSRMKFSKKILLDTTPELAANSAISLRRAKATGSA